MPTIVESWAVRGTHGRRPRHGEAPIEQAAAAALRGAGLRADDVDLLLNVGIHHRRNLGEPAHAALLQAAIGASPEDPHPGGHGTFSFDLANGSCGPLTAMEVADGFLRAGAVEHVLVLAGDSHPGARLAPGYPYAPAAAALVLGRTARPGSWQLVAVAWERSDEPDLLTARVGFDGHRNILTVDEHPDFATRAGVVAAKAAASVLADVGWQADGVDLVVAAPHRSAFLDGLAADLDLDGDRLVAPASAPTAHTAALLVAWDDAAASGRVERSERVLLVAAGAGICAGAAVLTRTEPGRAG